MLIISTSYQTNLTQNGYHLLPSAVVSYKQVSNIWTYFSLTHILLRSPKDISCSCRFSPLFQVVFLLIFYILMPEDFDLRIKKKKISFNLEWGFLAIFIIHTASDESTQFRCVEQPSLIMQKLTLPSLPLIEKIQILNEWRFHRLVQL